MALNSTGIRACACSASYSFADVTRTPGRSYRISREAKQTAQEYLQLSKKICDLKPKQLKSLPPFVLEHHMQAIVVAQKIPKENGARGRQENYLAKLLRADLEDPQFNDLKVCVEELQYYRLGPPDLRSLEIEETTTRWLQGFATSDNEVIGECISKLKEMGHDSQQVLKLARQLQLGPGQSTSITAQSKSAYVQLEALLKQTLSSITPIRER